MKHQVSGGRRALPVLFGVTIAVVMVDAIWSFMPPTWLRDLSMSPRWMVGFVCLQAAIMALFAGTVDPRHFSYARATLAIVFLLSAIGWILVQAIRGVQSVGLSVNWIWTIWLSIIWAGALVHWILRRRPGDMTRLTGLTLVTMGTSPLQGLGRYHPAVLAVLVIVAVFGVGLVLRSPPWWDIPALVRHGAEEE